MPLAHVCNRGKLGRAHDELLKLFRQLVERFWPDSYCVRILHDLKDIAKYTLATRVSNASFRTLNKVKGQLLKSESDRNPIILLLLLYDKGSEAFVQFLP